ncbi:MAG TPA: hypothetical protein VFU89_06770 [Rhabdochlamydiaceae bacterium]|nr:hypothetical protein [Rhabdochlamydiaceae bacterium]
MSGITPEMLAYLAAHEPHLATASSGNVNYNLPYGPGNDLSKNQTWGTGIPLLPNGQINISALIQQINKLFTWVTNGDQADTNTQLDIYALLRNIGAVWGQLNSQQQAELNQVFNASFTGPDGKTETVLQAIATDIINTIVGGTYFLNNKNLGDAQNMMNSIIYDLNPMIEGGASFLRPFEDAINNLNLSSYIDSLPPGLTMTTFMELQAFQFEQDFAMNPNVTGATNQQMHDWIQDLTAGLPADLALIILIMVVMMSVTGDQQVTLSGKSNETNALTKGVINRLASLQSAWNANQGKWTPATATAFYNSLAAVQFVVGGNTNGQMLNGDQRFQSDQTAVNQLYNDFNLDPQFNSGATGGITVTVPGVTTPVNLGTLYNCAQLGKPIPGTNIMVTMDGSNGSVNFCTMMNQISVDPANPTIPPASLTTVSADMSNALNATSSQSQSLGTAVQSFESVIQKFEQLITQILQCVLTFEKQTTSASASAGN